MHPNIDTLIIGGGISGMLTALELCQAGQSIAILDKSTSGQEASWAGGGILLPIYPWRQPAAISELVIHSLKIYPDLSRKLFSATGIDPEWHACGMLICKNPDHQQAENWCNTRQIRYQAAPAELLTALNTEIEHPLWLPDIAQARNPRLLKSLKTYLTQLGARFIEHCDITGIIRVAHKITAVHTQQGKLTPKQIALCTGAWTTNWLKRWLPDSALQLPIEPVRGQMLVFDASPDTLQHMILDGDHYLIPRRDGKILTGSTVEQAGFEKKPTAEAKEHLHRFATDLLPALKKHPICEHWAGLRPGTPEGIPYIGIHPDVDNLAINAGHFRNGLVMGPASAALLADLLLQRPPSIDPTPYSLIR